MNDEELYEILTMGDETPAELIDLPEDTDETE